MLGNYTQSYQNYLIAMDTNFPVNLDVTLFPVWHLTPPVINIGVNKDLVRYVLDKENTFSFNFVGQKQATLTIQLINKIPEDTDLLNNLDKEVLIKSIKFFNIEDTKFVWAGKFEPIYNASWKKMQILNGTPPPMILYNIDRLSWNGSWTLTFDIPVFTWMHKIQNLGWIYDT